jgi:hypothetical protein
LHHCRRTVCRHIKVQPTEYYYPRKHEVGQEASSFTGHSLRAFIDSSCPTQHRLRSSWLEFLHHSCFRFKRCRVATNNLRRRTEYRAVKQTKCSYPRKHEGRQHIGYLVYQRLTTAQPNIVSDRWSGGCDPPDHLSWIGVQLDGLTVADTNPHSVH